MARLQNIAERTGYHDLRLGIESGMVRTGLRIVLTSLIALLLVSGAQLPEMRADTQGTFRGQVVAAPRGERSAGLLYLKGHDGNVRRVVVVRASIVYDAAVPAGERKKPAKLALTPGAEVRVTALVDADSGEWTASRVEVIANHVAEFEDDYGEDAEPPDEVTVPKNPVVDRRTI